MGCRVVPLMVADSFLDLLDDSGAIGITALHCPICDEVLDPVILENRLHRPEPIRYRTRTVRKR